MFPVPGEDRDRQGRHVGRDVQQQRDGERRVVVEVHPDARPVDPTPQEDGGRVDRPGGHDDRRRRQLRSVGEAHPDRPTAVEHHPIDERRAAHLQVRAIAGRLQVHVVDRAAPPIGVAGQRRRLGDRVGSEERPADGAALRLEGRPPGQQRPLEPRRDVTPRPAGATEVGRPRVVVIRLARQRDHGVDRRRAADAASAQVHPRLLPSGPAGEQVRPGASGHGDGRLERRAEDLRRRVGRPLGRAGLQQQHPSGPDPRRAGRRARSPPLRHR